MSARIYRAARAATQVAMVVAAFALSTSSASAEPRTRARWGGAPAVVGTVRDTAGAPLPNVQVVIASLNRVTSTDPTGSFTFRGLAPGRYHLDAILLGFARADAEVIVPNAGDDVRVNIVMRTTALRLSNVTVSASPVGGDALGITQATIDLSGKELARNLGASVSQTLANEPGMAMRYNGPAANVPVIRGLTGDRILVLQDGDRTGDLSAPSADHGLTIDPLSANRIEVVRGPASLLYGSSALGGVVNVVSNDIPTSVPTHVAGYVAGMGESVNPGGAASGSIAFPLGRALALQVGGGFRTSGDVYQGGGERLFNSDSRNNNQVIGLGYIGEEASAGVAFRRYDFRYGLPSTADDAEAGAKLDGARNDVRGRAEIGGAGAFRLFRIDGSAQSYKHDEIESSGEVATSFDLKTQTLNGVAKTLFGVVDGAFGVNALFKQYAATGEEALTPAANSNSAGIFAFQDIPLGKADGELVPRLQIGARYDAFRIESKRGDAKFGPATDRSFNTFSGSLGLTIPFGQMASVGVSAARAFRAPSVEELFSNALHAATGFFEVGDADLSEETNQGVDGVFRVQSGTVDAQLAAYYSTIENYIFTQFVKDTITDEGAVPLVRYTQRDARLRGFEGRVEAEVAPRLVLGAMADMVRASFVGGGNVPFMPPARIGVLGRWEHGRWSLGGDVRRGLEQNRTAGDDVDIPTDAYTLLNLSAGFNVIVGGLVHSVTLRADNLLDEQYRDASSRIKTFAYNPGRNVAVVYKMLF